ncbi:MAG: hypothetical protein ACLSFJ_01435 [Holdemania filiformis]
MSRARCRRKSYPIHESTMPSLINHTLTYAQNKLADSECGDGSMGGGERSSISSRRLARWW